MSTKEQMVDALAEWIKLSHVSTHGDASANSLRCLAATTSTVSQVFAEATDNLLHAADEMESNRRS